MTSEWVSTQHSSHHGKVYDKDFKKLNKIATANRVTTCRDQYRLRQHLGDHVRIKDPNQTLRSQAFERGAVRVDHAASYGKPNRPSTPIKDVVNEEYARASQQHQAMKNAFNEEQFLSTNKFRGSRQHTRATSMAADHLNSTRASVLTQSHDMFKMSQFKNVHSRVGKHHTNGRK